MADIRQIPIANYPAYYGSGLLNLVNEAISKPFGYENDPVRGLTNLLGVPAAVKTLENVAYGLPNVTGTGMATQLRPEAKETLTNVLPLAPAATKVAAKGLIAAGKYAAPKAGQMAEQYAVRTGLLQPMVPMGTGQMSDIVPGVKAGDELIVQHNLSEANLKYADKLGGLPAPSLGISKASTPFEKFGEVTLIAPKEFAVPSAKNPVFMADAYTKRFPSITYQFDKKSDKALDNILKPTTDKMPQGFHRADLQDEWRNREYSGIMQSKFLDEKGLLPNKDEFKNRWDFSSEVRNRTDQLRDEYTDWLNKFDERLVAEGAWPKEKLYKGMTYSGTRMYRDATLENIVKEMKGGAATENWNYGVGNLRAAASPKFKKLDDIKASRGLLTDEKSMSTIKDQTDKAYMDLLDRLRKYNANYDASDALLEIAQTKNTSVLNRHFDGADDKLKADIGLFLNKFKTMPAEYFEIKPQRAVALQEFSGALIPKTASEKTKEILKKRGLEIYEYSTPEERASLMQKFGKEMFVGAPIGTGLLSGQQEKSK
jgi:hypothetical protein